MKVLIIGAGAWGTALGNVLAENGHEVHIYSNKDSVMNEINNFHTNERYLEKITLSERLKCVVDYVPYLSDTDFIVLAVPSAAIEEVLSKMIPSLNKKYVFVNVIKGFVGSNNETMISYLKKIIPQKNVEGICSLIGPSYASEVAKKLITTICAVCSNQKISQEVQLLFSNDYFRVYTNKDEIGCEIASAYKNAIAIGSGILFGMGFGQNGRAALITRGLNEMKNFAIEFGGKERTFLGLTGVGDLVLTCNSNESRNFSFGESIGKTLDVDAVLANNQSTIEGYRTISCLYQLSKQKNLNTPIVDALFQVIYLKKDIKKTLRDLMERPLNSED